MMTAGVCAARVSLAIFYAHSQRLCCFHGDEPYGAFILHSVFYISVLTNIYRDNETTCMRLKVPEHLHRNVQRCISTCGTYNMRRAICACCVTREACHLLALVQQLILNANQLCPLITSQPLAFKYASMICKCCFNYSWWLLPFAK
jgi:hypothetical protein